MTRALATTQVGIFRRKMDPIQLPNQKEPTSYE